MQLSKILDAMFPSACAGCGAGEGPICDGCLPNRRATCRFRIGPMDVVALGSYEGSLRSAILAFKRGRRDVGCALARALAKLLVPASDSLLVPVPTTPRRQAERGFDQAVLLAREVGRLTGFGVLDVLRQTAGDAQRGRSRSARLHARGRFRCTATTLVDGVQVILVDDVATTGATLCDCAAVLTAAGARVTAAVVIARAR